MRARVIAKDELPTPERLAEVHRELERMLAPSASGHQDRVAQR